MATKLSGRLTLTRIPRELIQSNTDKDGNQQKFIYVDIVPNKDGADQYGNTHSIQIYDKANRKAIYLGNLKTEEFGGKGGNGGGHQSNNGSNDLPF